MAMAAIAGGDAVRLVRDEARVTAVEARAIGVHVNSDMASIVDQVSTRKSHRSETRSIES